MERIGWIDFSNYQQTKKSYMILTTMMQKNNSNTWNKIFQVLE